MKKEERQPEFNASTFLNPDFEPSFLYPIIGEEETETNQIMNSNQENSKK
ncbi:hypothetical protein [Cerasibacillus terrae]|nr:hypothetical protein [Cerasibacillus terrae]